MGRKQADAMPQQQPGRGGGGQVRPDGLDPAEEYRMVGQQQVRTPIHRLLGGGHGAIQGYQYLADLLLFRADEQSRVVKIHGQGLGGDGLHLGEKIT